MISSGEGGEGSMLKICTPPRAIGIVLFFCSRNQFWRKRNKTDLLGGGGRQVFFSSVVFSSFLAVTFGIFLFMYLCVLQQLAYKWQWQQVPVRNELLQMYLKWDFFLSLLQAQIGFCWLLLECNFLCMKNAATRVDDEINLFEKAPNL